MNAPATELEPRLLFEWAPPKGEKFLITVFLIGSLFVHALAFYLFRIIYPPAIAVLPPPAHISLIGSNSEEGRSLLRWIEAEDPALASATIRPNDTRVRTLPKLEHIPSYMAQEPKLKDAPPMPTLDIRAEAFPPGPAPITRPAEPPWPKTSTRVLFSEELTALGQPTVAPLQFTGSTGEPPENVRFRVAVNQRGEVRYCFRVNSSGDSALDEQARLWLVRCRFNFPAANAGTDGEKLVWGIATVAWGNDVSQPARPAGAATP